MKKWISTILTVILLVGLGTNTFLYFQQNNKLNNLNGRISDLLTNINTIQTDVDLLENNTTVLEQNLSDLSTGVDNMEDKIANVEDIASGLGEDIANIRNNVNSLSTSISAINSGMENLNGNIDNITSDIIALQETDNAIMDVAAKVEPAVVFIIVGTTSGYYSGSGAIIRNDGYILTAYHVIEDATEILVYLSTGETYSAYFVSGEYNLDAAIIKMNSSRNDFPIAKVGSSATTRIGEEVLAIGYPLGSYLPGQATFTRGIVSGIRNMYGYNYIQTDAALNHGNSGGPLLNMKGEIIGINDWKISVDTDGVPIDNVAFAIAIDDAKYLIDML